jgi:hypothetical protein
MEFFGLITVRPGGSRQGIAAAIATLLKCIESGRRPGTDPSGMNKLAKKLLPELPARFVHKDPVKFSRPHNAPVDSGND